MRSIIIDDEPLARKGIHLLVDQVTDLFVVGEFSNPLLAHKFLTAGNQVDLVFLDIEMPGLSGLEYLETMPPDAKVILTTAYPQYALEAFELNVIDYLVKPIKLGRFIKAVERVREINELHKSEINIQPQKEYIYIKSDRKYIKLAYDQIRYIKGLKDYVIIYAGDQRFMTAMNVATIHRQLPQTIFARVSKSYIINVHFVASIDLDTIDLGGQEIPLGRSYKEKFLEDYIKGNLLKR